MPDPVKAAKEHRCQWCGEAITVGTVYIPFSTRVNRLYVHKRFHMECFPTAQLNANNSLRVPDFMGLRPSTSAKTWTVIVERSKTISQVAWGPQIGSRDIFICRVEATDRQHADCVAQDQCLEYDLVLYAKKPELFLEQPTSTSYRTQFIFAGYPSLIRPDHALQDS